MSVCFSYDFRVRHTSYLVYVRANRMLIQNYWRVFFSVLSIRGIAFTRPPPPLAQGNLISCNLSSTFGFVFDRGLVHTWCTVRIHTYVLKDSTAVATNTRSMIFVTIVSCVRWCVFVFDPIYSGASLRLSVYLCLTYQPGFEKEKTNTML